MKRLRVIIVLLFLLILACQGLPLAVKKLTFLPPGSSFEANSRYGDWQISIDKVLVAETITSTDSDAFEKAEGRFVILFLSVTNRGSSTNTFIADANFFIKDGEGTVYDENYLASAYAQSQYPVDIGAEINPDETKHVVAVYDISTQSSFYYVVPSILSEINSSVFIQVP